MRRSLSVKLAAGVIALSVAACNSSEQTPGTATPVSSTDTAALKPVVITEKVLDDSDDPAIWINPANPDSSLIVGTDKNSENGGLYVFHLDGKIDRQRTVTGLHRMNNVDIAYGLPFGDSTVDIAVATERDLNTIRVFSLPAMKAIDGGGVEVFKNDTARSPMGVALYTRASDKAIFAIVSRKSGPAEGYLEQYLLKDNGKGKVVGELVRKFGKYSGKKEIESIAVDNELGYVYYSDEQVGIRKYYADPQKGNEELALFGQGQYKEDNEGISIYKFSDGTGYILVSDQAAGKFNVYAREGSGGKSHEHPLIVSLQLSTEKSDGSDVTSVSLPGYPGGLFVAMSEGGYFQFYSWKQLAERGGLKVN
jgi:3-phytase